MNLASIVDCHTHSNFSADSQMSIRNGIVSTLASGLKGLAFTDHLDIDYPNPAYNFSFDYVVRANILEQFREEYKGRITILNGLELGFQPHIANEANYIIKNHNFDFVICSIHTIDNFDFYHTGFFEGKTKNQAYHRYLEAIYESVDKFDNFDVVGHIGYICRYAPPESKSFKYADHHEMLNTIFKRVIEKGKGIEVNTAGFNYNLDMPHPDYEMLKQYKKLGGHIITIGSDAHTHQRIGEKFNLVIKQLANIGFTYIAYFENRKPIFVKIK